jgi:hypothetical protein
MITSLRLHGQREALPVPQAPVPPAEHQLAIQELTRSYEIKLQEARAGGSGGGPTAADMKAAVDRIAELEALLGDSRQETATQVAALQEELGKETRRAADLEALLELATATPKVQTEAAEPKPVEQPQAVEPEAPAVDPKKDDSKRKPR